MVIHDRSYARWDGDKSAPPRPVPVILAGGIRRGVAILFRRKIPAVGLILAAFGPFVFSLGFLYVRYYVLRNVEKFGQLSEVMASSELSALVSASAENVYSYLFVYQSLFVVIACVMIGSGLVAEDRRANALELYLSRPITVAQYLLGKLAIIGFFVAVVTVIPATILVMAQISLSWGDMEEVGRLLGLLLRTIGAGALWVAIPSLLIVTASSLAQKARNAAILFLAVVFLLQVFSNILREIFASDSFFLLQVGFNIRQIGAWILGDTVNLLTTVPLWQSAGVLAVWVAVCVTTVLRRVRPVEVVA